MTWTPEGREDQHVWIPCGTCWGQRRVFHASAEDGRLAAVTCPSCLGIGERLAGGDHVPAAAA